MQANNNHVLIMMGGTGTRFGASIPKQFVEVDGRPVFTYLVEAYEKFDLVADLTIVCHSDWVQFTQKWIEEICVKKPIQIVPGGANRSQSVQFGLNGLYRTAALDDIVLIHDVTHPFLDEANVIRCVNAAREVGAATLVGSCFDTMYETDSNDDIRSVVKRERIVSATAPECFQFGVIYPLYANKTVEELERMTSAGAMMIANGQRVRVVRTPLINLKITLHEDLEAFKRLMHGYYFD